LEQAFVTRTTAIPHNGAVFGHLEEDAVNDPVPGFATLVPVSMQNQVLVLCSCQGRGNRSGKLPAIEGCLDGAFEKKESVILPPIPLN
jgi:hypothetical protein